MKGSDFYRIEKAIHFLNENVESQPSLKDLAGFLGLSEFHCHRLFKKWAGITPKDFLQILTLSKAKSLLMNSESVLDASHGVGLSGSSRLHDLFIQLEAMTPGEYKNGGEGLEIDWGIFDSPLGNMALGITERGICSLSFSDRESEVRRDLKSRWPRATLTKNLRAVKPFAQEVSSRISGKAGRSEKKLKLLVQGTLFQVKVWEALLRIPEGELTTYQDIAALIGSPKAVRAVGSAVGANPIGYLIPCHRVIKSTGAIGEYHWGSARKTALLAIERGRILVPLQT